MVSQSPLARSAKITQAKADIDLRIAAKTVDLDPAVQDVLDKADEMQKGNKHARQERRHLLLGVIGDTAPSPRSLANNSAADEIVGKPLAFDALIPRQRSLGECDADPIERIGRVRAVTRQRSEFTEIRDRNRPST
jgi:hypothetical protein